MTAVGDTPCITAPHLYDAVLFDEDVAEGTRDTARREAARLCAGCPMVAGCADRVTADTAPRHLASLPDGWMPPVTEGRAAPVEPPRRTWSAERRAGAAITVGRDYIRPHQRLTAWARMAAEDAARGASVAEIAWSLCVSEDTVRALLAHRAGVAA